jgi:hypothetical protein
MGDDDEPIDSAVLNVAVAATQLMTLAENITLQYGPEVARNGLLVAYTVLAERALGRDGMLDELHVKIAAITANPTIMDAVIKWLH